MAKYLNPLTRQQFDNYQRSLMCYSEVKNVEDTAFEKGKIEGKEEGKMEV